MNQYRDYCKPSNKPPLPYELDETDPMERGGERGGRERERGGERGGERERQRERDRERERQRERETEKSCILQRDDIT